jgi:hypothetical protein
MVVKISRCNLLLLPCIPHCAARPGNTFVDAIKYIASTNVFPGRAAQCGIHGKSNKLQRDILTTMAIYRFQENLKAALF